jgi:hypothetical protein
MMARGVGFKTGHCQSLKPATEIKTGQYPQVLRNRSGKENTR